MLSSNSAELQGEATQLIQYKILLTYILEGKDNMVDSFLSKFELSNDTPAVQYGNAAIALQHKDEKAAKEWIAAAEKNFSPQLNKLFAESLYEAGWLKKPEGQARAALELTSAAERTARTKAYAKSRLDQAQQAFQKRDMITALKLLDEADAADPNQPAYTNLRGEILMEQKDFDQAEAMFKKALKADPKYPRSAVQSRAGSIQEKGIREGARSLGGALCRYARWRQESGGAAHQIQNFHDAFARGQRQPRAKDDGSIPVHGRHASALLCASRVGV